MKEKNESSASELEKMLGMDESLEGKVHSMYSKRKALWKESDDVLDRLKERCESIDSQLHSAHKKLGYLRRRIAQADLGQTADELAWFKEMVNTRKKALLRDKAWIPLHPGYENA